MTNDSDISAFEFNILQSRSNEDYQVVSFSGDLDKLGLNKVKPDLEKLVNGSSKKYLVFDFSRLSFINSEGIGFIMALHSHLVKNKQSLVVVNAIAHVKDVLSVIGILNVVEYFDSFEQFLQKINE